MKIVHISGGLGNQMFQYAFGLALKRAYPSDIIKYNCSFYDRENTSQQGLELERIFSLSLNKTSPEDTTYIQATKNKLARRILRNIHAKYNMQLNENPSYIPPWIFSMKQDVEYMGYWQSEQYFQNCRDEVRKVFSFPASQDPQILDLFKQIDEDTSSVSIHIRKGDYHKNPKFKEVHGFLDMGYYHRAIKIITQKVPHPSFYVFSDNIELSKEDCKELAQQYPMCFVDCIGDRDNYYYNIEAMSRCRHNIIAHSTFSWWGAWLNDRPDKIVVAPNKWYADTQPKDYKKITNIKIPPSWLLASVE